jgi:hypothetical protein
MARQISTLADVQNQGSSSANVNDFKDRLVKLIPSEIVTAYITLQGLISSQQENVRLYVSISFVSLLILTPIYLLKVSGVTKISQIIFTTIAFVIWVMAIGGFGHLFPNVAIFNNNFLGSIILIIYTLLIPIVYKG